MPKQRVLRALTRELSVILTKLDDQKGEQK